MPEPFKNFFNPDQVRTMAAHLSRNNTGFDAQSFEDQALQDFDSLELKQRSNQICEALAKALPENFDEACNILTAALHPTTDAEISDLGMDELGIAGWSIMPIADFVANNSQNNFETSMTTLGELTKRFSAEFAIRQFFIAEPKRTLEQALAWAKSDNMHLRRLASEGSRPRLPWGLQLRAYVEDPTPLLPLLEMLRDDESEYVRRSVANNLNDIAKDHPDLVAELAGKWLTGADSNRIRLVKHACRSLVKAGHQPTLTALGYSEPNIEVTEFSIKQDSIKIGGKLEFDLQITSLAETTQPLIVDYAVHHVKANGATSPKTFKWKISDLAAGKSLKLKKAHSFKPVTTRVYYRGTHSIEVLINGKPFAKSDFELSM